MDGLPSALGNCVSGQSQSETVCGQGSLTGVFNGHVCANGGLAGPTAADCRTGSIPRWFDPETYR